VACAGNGGQIGGFSGNSAAGQSGSGGSGAGVAGAAAGSGGSGGLGASLAGGSAALVTNPLSPAYRPTDYALPEPADAATCSGAANPSAKIEHFAFAQTHVMEPSWPLFFLVAGRPALVEAVVTGSGAAPEVRVQASIGGTPVGELCLAGPPQLPASVDWSQQRKADRYTATLPSAWLKPGLSVTVTAGAAHLSFTADQLGVSAAPDLNLVMLPVDVLNYNQGKDDIPIPDTWFPDFAGAAPAAHFRFGQFPARVPLPELVVSADGSGGVDPVLLTRRPCDQGETSPDCVASDIGGMSIQAAVLRVISAIHSATGEFSYAYYYGNTQHFEPGGWGGGKNFVGADFTGIFIHEIGHALSLPHWGEGAFQNTSPKEGDYRYPYGGNGNDGGGRGESWNYYQDVAEFTSPICQIKDNENFGLERSDAMQRNADCDEMRSTGVGPWDGYGDFSALAEFRYMKGATEAYAGTVPYRGADAPFHLPPQTGFPNLVVDATGKRSLVRANQPTDLSNEERYDFMVPQAWDVPVATLYGTYHPSVAAANVLYAPLEYQGTLPHVLDPTDSATFSQLAKGGAGPYEDYFYWPKDLTLQVTYDDGSQLVALYPFDSVDRNWKLQSGPWRYDLLYFALNVPRNKPIKQVDLYERPFVVRGASDTDAGNIANPTLGITAQTFMKDAKLVTSWKRP